MKTHLLAATCALALSTGALAQTQTPAPAPAPSTTQPATPAPSAPTSTTTTTASVNGAPLENGANSFTENQAKERLEAAGISGVTGLAKDDNGIWRGRGSWQGRSVAVGLDFRGNISAQ